MPEFTVPLFTPETRRGMAQNVSVTKDAYLGACVLEKVTDSASSQAIYYVQKRPGLTDGGTLASGNIGTLIFVSPANTRIISAWGGSNSTVYDQATSAGTVTGVISTCIETIISGTVYWLMTSNDGTGWYLANGAISTTAYTGNTHTSTTVDNISPNTTGMYAGQAITGSGFQAGTRIASVDSSSAITLTLATTTSLVGTALTKTPIAKILSANFPVAVGQFAQMDGFIFVVNAAGRLYNSDINSITSWQASSYIEANLQTDTAWTCFKYKNHILVFGNQSIEFFYNAGNAFGSPLVSRKELFSNVGIYGVTAQPPNVTQIRDYVFFISSDQCLYTFEEFSPKNLSRQGMSLGGKIGSTTYAALPLTAFPIGSDIIIHVLASNQTTLDKWYSVTNDFFYEPNLSYTLKIVDPQNYASINVGIAVDAGGTSGKVINVDDSVYQDIGAAFTMTIQTQPYYINNGLPFIIDNITLIADTQSSGSSTLSSTADDYATFGTIGSFDLTQQQKNLSGGGYYDSSVAFKLTDSGNNAWRGQALKITWRPAK